MEVQLDEINSVREKLQGSEVNLKKELRVCIRDFTHYTVFVHVYAS